jgi:uncharacterized membrane protein
MLSKPITAIAAAAALLSVGACSNMDTTQQRTLSGAGLGAGGGALIGAVAGGNPLVGAAIGAGAGAAGGYIYDQNQKAQGNN